MAIAIPKKEQDTITFTKQELQEFLASFKEEIIEEVKRELIAPLRDSIVDIRKQSAQCTSSLIELEKKMDYIYLPIKQERRAAAEARLAARPDFIDEEDN